VNTNEILSLASEIVKSWDWATEISQPTPKQLDVKVNSVQELVSIVVALRVKRLGHLSAIVGLDLGPQVNEIEVLYHFCPGDAIIVLRLRVPRHGGSLPSLCDVVPSAEGI
jgi:NADH:ubiquinone oxidoreductase subunit C